MSAHSSAPTANRGLRIVMRSLGALLGGTMAASLFSMLTQTLLARSLSAEEYGQLAALLTVANLLSSIASAGVNWFLLQLFGEEGCSAYRWMPSITRLLCFSFLISVLLMSAYTVFGSSVPDNLRVSIWLAGLAVMFGQAAVDLASSRLQLEGRYSALALWQAATQAARLVLVFAIAAIQGGKAPMSQILFLYGITGVIVAATGWWVCRGLWRRTLKAPPGAIETKQTLSEPPSLGTTFKHTIPFAWMTIFYVLYFQWPVVLLDWQLGGSAAASYNAALLLIAAASMLPQVIYMKFLTPIICRWAVHDRNRFKAVFHLGAVAMLLTGLAGTAVLGLGSPWIIPLIFGNGLPDAVMVLSILSLGLPLRFVHSSFSATFVSPSEVAAKVGYLGWSALCGIAANLTLVPLLGLIGAPIAALVGEIVLLALHVKGARRLIKGLGISQIFRPSTSRSSYRVLMEHRHAE